MHAKCKCRERQSSHGDRAGGAAPAEDGMGMGGWAEQQKWLAGRNKRRAAAGVAATAQGIAERVAEGEGEEQPRSPAAPQQAQPLSDRWTCRRAWAA